MRHCGRALSGASVGLWLLGTTVARPACVLAQAAIRGRVVADSSGQPLGGAEVLLSGRKRPIVADAGGSFQLGDLAPGAYQLLVRQVGFRPETRAIQLNGPDTVAILIRLQRAAVRLDSLVVEGRPTSLSVGLQGMDERRLRGIGKFITTAELRDLDGRRTLPELLRSMGVNFERDWQTGRLLPVGPRGATQMKVQSCQMQVVLDWAPLDISPKRGMDIESIPISRLGGIEIYKGISETPLIFERGESAACGVIVLWTRDQ